MKRPDLANTMNLISENGTKGFYEGEVAQKIVTSMANNGGRLQLMIFKIQSKIFATNWVNYRGKSLYLMAHHLEVDCSSPL